MADEHGNIKLSKFVHLYMRNNYIALWHSLNMDKVYGNKSLLHIYSFFNRSKLTKDKKNIFPKGIIKGLIEKGFLVRTTDNCEYDLYNNLQKFVGNIEVKNLVILVSNLCNYNCSYCQIEENIDKKNKVHMTHETARKALGLFRENSSFYQEKTITITGGEPLLNIPVVKFIIEYVRKYFKNTRIALFTNGSLVTMELARYFKKNNILMLVSIDGPKYMHDIARKDKYGKGTFGSSLKGYNTLVKEKCNVGISAVSGVHNNLDLNKTFDFFIKLNPQSIGFNFPHLLINKHNPVDIPIEYFCDILISFYKITREKGIFLENIARSITSFSHNKPRINECQAQGRGFTVDARGKIGPCKSLLVNDIYSLDIKEIKNINTCSLFKNWALRSPIIQKGCKYCPALTICGGGCAYDSYINNRGDFKQIDKRHCKYEKEVLKYLIWDLFEKVKKKMNGKDIYFPELGEQDKAFNNYYNKNNEIQRSVGHEVS